MILNSDVAIVGGGPAGIAAAIAAARAGANVILVEKNPFLGGCATLGSPLNNYFNYQGQQCINGIAGEILARLQAMGGTTGPFDVPKAQHISKTTPINEDLLGILCLEMLEEEGVKFLPQTVFCSVTIDQSTIKSIELSGKGENYRLASKVYIDCTGDADVFAAAGLPFEKGRPSDGRLQPMGQMFRLGNVDMERFLNKAGVSFVVGVKPGESKESVIWFSGSLAPWNNIIADQKLFIGKDRLFWGNSLHSNQFNINITSRTGFDPTKPEEYAKAEVEGKRQAYQAYQFLKDNVDGFENCYLSKMAPFVGIRESRRIVGAYQLTKEDFLEGRVFPDSIARSGYPIDIHDPAGGSKTTFIQVRNHGSFSIPYRCLYNAQCKNLLVAGRPISTTHESHGATRVMVTCMATGQAAGIAAAIASRRKISIENVDIQDLQKMLINQKAIL